MKRKTIPHDASLDQNKAIAISTAVWKVFFEFCLRQSLRRGKHVAMKDEAENALTQYVERNQ